MRGVLTRSTAVTLAVVGVYTLVLRRRQLRWGATPKEATGPLPGDELLSRADLVATRAITIRRGVEDVWPWLAQMGQGRGGLYSYDWLENLAGCQMHSADQLVPDWQQLALGDDFRLHPDVALTVAHIDPPAALVVRGGVSPGGRPTVGDPAAPYDFTWAFVLTADGPSHARLLIRERYLYRTPWARPLVETVSVVSFAMTERMLRGIRDRTEGRLR